MSAYATVRDRLAGGQGVVLDGGIGSELVRRGVRWRDHGLSRQPDAVLGVHVEYLEAGADVIRTNTFQLNRRVYRNVFRDLAHMRHIGAPDLDQRVPMLLPRAVEIAREARTRVGRPDVAIAGVMSPLEHCFRPDLAPSGDAAGAEHAEIANLLAGAGVDLLLLESMNTLAEARLAALAARATGLPVWVSFVVAADGNLLSGEPLADALDGMDALGVDAVLVNCAPPDDIGRAVSSLPRNGRPFGGYAHVGKFDPPSWKFEFFPQFSQTETWPADRYADAASAWRSSGARIVGGCCGTRPEHVRALKEGMGA